MSPGYAVSVLVTRGWTVAQLAKEVGLHRSNIYPIWYGNSVPRHETAMKLINLAKSGRKATINKARKQA